MKALFVTSNRVGDAVLSTGVLGWLIETYPSASFTVACGPVATSLFESCPAVERVIPLRKGPYGRHWLALWRECVTSFWTVVVDLRGSALAWALPHARHRILRPSRAPKHRVQMLGDLMGKDPPPPPRVWLNDEHRSVADQLLPGKGYLALGPTANWGGKQWPEDRFLDLALRVTASGGLLPGAKIVVFGADGERSMVSSLLAGLDSDKLVDMIGKTDIPTAAACLQRCDLFVGNDSGLMHLAAAANVPTLGLFGPSPELHYAPWGPRASFVRTDESFEEIIGAPDYDYKSQSTRMGSLTVERVEAGVRALLKRLEPTP